LHTQLRTMNGSNFLKYELQESVSKYPVASYFTLTFALSWLGAFVLVAPKLINGRSIEKLDGILMFPLMLLGPVVATIILIAASEGKEGFRNLWSRMIIFSISRKIESNR
jgi:hypothetical protein